MPGNTSVMERRHASHSDLSDRLRLFTGLAPAQAQLRGHGGPVRALAVSGDGETAISGSFDTSAILCSLERNAAEQVLRLHDGAVNAVAFLKDGRAVTAGEDARIGVWTAGAAGARCRARRAWWADRRARGVARRRHARLGFVEPHHPPVAAHRGRAACARGQRAKRQRRRLYARRPGGGQRRLRRDLAHLEAARRRRPAIATLPASLNAVVVAPDGEIVAAGADGKLYFLSLEDALRGSLEAAPTPVIALALSGNGERIAAASIGGSVAILDRKTRLIARMLSGSGQPVWSVVFLPDNHTLLTGGADRIIRRWDTETWDPVATSRPAAPRIRSPPMPAIRAPRCSAPASPVIRLSPTRATAPARPCTASSGGASRRCRATISPKR